MKKPNYYFKLVALAFLAAILLGVNSPQVAYAGANGQQLRIEVCRTFNSFDSSFYYQATVTGKNQRGDTVTWNSGNYKMGACKIETKGWWWVGKVEITVRRKLLPIESPTVRSTSVKVPKFQLIGNWTTVKVQNW